MSEREPCELLSKAKGLAIKRGLNPATVECPVEQVCPGQICYLLSKLRKETSSEGKERKAPIRKNP